MFNEQENNAPISAGGVHDVTIEGIAREGDGIARIQGFVIFVPGTKVGDNVTITIEKVMRKFAIAALTEKS
ncbi:MAG: TRAM domain-containing protein [Candidatus Methanoperedens sp.]|nr:TRAM domain-containing protein [Candidatus Methanoperedens sp.]MCE8424564.1 TRAM domain-containing protein [Candidatus Methanoperedens sp.]MCE8427764.1 TRAM domain-containing protein [Candidatus Methanoperedens sp.]